MSKIDFNVGIWLNNIMDDLSDREVLDIAIEIIDAMIQFRKIIVVHLFAYFSQKYTYEYPPQFRIRDYKQVMNAMITKGMLKNTVEYDEKVGFQGYEQQYVITLADDILQALEQNVFSSGKELILPTPEKATILKLYLDEKYFAK